MLCAVLNACLLQNVTFDVSLTARKRKHISPAAALLYMALTYCTAQAHQTPIISPAHVFEEVEVSQLNAKQDLLGLSPGLRQFSLLLTLFQNRGR